MAKSSTIGLLKNVSTAAGSACPRQEAAQIIYNALTLPILQANALGVLVPSSDTILSKYLGGASEVVVVTDNEEASLNYSYVQDEGITLVNNEKTELKWSTGLDDIGESFTIWTVGNTVIYAEKANNTVWTTSASTNEKAISDRDTGLKLTGAAQYVNFGEDTIYSVSDYKISYRVATNSSLTAAEKALVKAVAPAGYTEGDLVDVSIKPNTEITSADLDVIKLIFDYASSASIGEVYVGTQNSTDISDTLSYKAFLAKYLTDETDGQAAKVNQNGNYIKVIDNDGDGVAEYILQTKYTMDAVTSIAKNGTYTLAAGTEIAADALVSEDEITVGDVIVYAKIDGVYYANLAEVVTDTIDYKGINYKTKVITCGDNTYGQSEITLNLDKFNAAFLYDTFQDDVTNAEVEKAYDLYLDNYGYVRAYTANKYTNGLGLLTDAYYYTNYRTAEAKVTMVTADTEATDYDVSTSGAHWNDAGFIDTTEGGDNGNRGTWKRLNAMEGFKTNVAAYSEADGVLTLGDPTTSYTNKEQDIIKEELALTSTDTLSTRTFTTDSSKTVRVTTDTVYYYVDARNNVTTWTGYENAPKKLTLDADQNDIAYTVATKTKVSTNSGANAGYYYANVIVIEAQSSTSNVYFGYYSNTKTGKDASYWLNAVGPYTDDDDNTVYGTTTEKIEKFDDLQQTPAFYKITGAKVSLINENYNKNGIYASTVKTGADIYNRNYIELANKVGFYPSEVPVYVINKDSNTNLYLAYTATEMDIDDIQVDDELIYFVENKQVVYAIDASASELGRLGTPDVTTLWNQINGEQTSAADNSALLYKVAFNGHDYVIDTKANTYEYTIRVKSTELTYASGTPVFTATALSAKAPVTVKHSSGTVAGTGTGSASDTVKTTDITTNSVWTVVVDGTEFTIKVAVQSNDASVSYKGVDGNVALKNGNTVQISKSTVTADDLVAATGATINSVTGGATISSVATGTPVTITTTAEDGTTATYTLTGVTVSKYPVTVTVSKTGSPKVTTDSAAQNEIASGTTLIPNNANYTFYVTASDADHEVISVKYQLGSDAEVTKTVSADGSYTIPVSEFKSNTTLTITVEEVAKPEITSAAGNVSIQVNNVGLAAEQKTTVGYNTTVTIKVKAGLTPTASATTGTCGQISQVGGTDEYGMNTWTLPNVKGNVTISAADAS
jgi:hypothetical protein